MNLAVEKYKTQLAHPELNWIWVSVFIFALRNNFYLINQIKGNVSCSSYDYYIVDTQQKVDNTKH